MIDPIASNNSMMIAACFLILSFIEKKVLSKEFQFTVKTTINIDRKIRKQVLNRVLLGFHRIIIIFKTLIYKFLSIIELYSK